MAQTQATLTQRSKNIGRRLLGERVCFALMILSGFLTHCAVGGAEYEYSEDVLSVRDVPRRADVPNTTRDVLPPVGDAGANCPGGETENGRCDGNNIIYCAPNGMVQTQLCTNGASCVGGGATRARCEAAPPPMPGQLSGNLTFIRRPITAAGLQPGIPRPLARAALQLLDANTMAVRANAVANEMGHYVFDSVALNPNERVLVRVLATRMDAQYQLSVRNHSGAAYSVTTPVITYAAGLTRDVNIDEASNSGAFAIYDTIRRGLDFVRANLPSAAPFVALHWERGRTTPGQTSYFVPGENKIYLLGGPNDTDEFDEPVILHEFGHFVEANFSHSDSPGGAHDGSPTDPRQAWGEGYGTWFGCVANGSPIYLDSVLSGGASMTDLSALPANGNYVANPGGGLAQPVSEYLVGGTLWAITAAGDRTTQVGKQLSVSVRYFRRNPPPSRGFQGIDLVDFLDGYLCLNNGADRAVIQSYLVTQRRFPYDFAAVNCR